MCRSSWLQKTEPALKRKERRQRTWKRPGRTQRIIIHNYTHEDPEIDAAAVNPVFCTIWGLHRVQTDCFRGLAALWETAYQAVNIDNLLSKFIKSLYRPCPCLCLISACNTSPCLYGIVSSQVLHITMNGLPWNILVSSCRMLSWTKSMAWFGLRLFPFPIFVYFRNPRSSYSYSDWVVWCVRTFLLGEVLCTLAYRYA